MVLRIETTHRPATDLGYLLHKNPAGVQSFEQGFGLVHVFYPEASEDRCEVAVLLDVDPIGLVRGRGENTLDQYVNDRPYVASSFLSVALNKLFSTAMNGRSKERQELVETPLPLKATLAVVPSRGGEDLLHRLFEPLGYKVTATHHPLDEKFESWGDGPYYTLTLEHTLPLQMLLQHLYVLVPVLDNDKHYWVGEDEVEKLLARGSSWLPSHPEKDLIARRYLKHQHRLTRDALARLAVETDPDPDASEREHDAEEERIEKPLSLNAQRLGSVLAALKASGATSVLDLGCGEGNLLRDLLKERQFSRIVGMDVSIRSLERASEKLKMERLPDMQRQRIELLHGSLIYRDERLRPDGQPFDAAACVEVIEHLDPPRLRAFERAVFEFARPGAVVLTTPNAEYNVMWETLPAGQFRHRDHRFEWTREEFRTWAERVASEHGYSVRFLPVGPVDEAVGSPTQMGVFTALQQVEP
ncbi:MAG: 3' terminal RNA ribose 2'-O-methyltransferase Hen1 [Phycisphaerales bacterium]|jgi:3' terminal RNA ribose 2'-O-methyltransferase Hen1|nr:3' terminal RNA ribose 2'-O-methyltransferase Hen1 [Phycisphaerales bacterium]